MLLSNPFRPDPRVHKEAKALVSAGYKVSIAAWDRAMKFSKDEVIDGITIERFGPMAGYGSILSHFFNLPRFWKKCFHHAMNKNFDILHAHDFDTLFPGVLISWLKNVPLVYDAHESYGMMTEGGGGSKFLGKMIDYLEEKTISHTSEVIVVNPSLYVYRGIYKSYKKGKIKEPKLIMNCRDMAIDYQPIPEGSDLKLGYVGVLEPGRKIVDAAEVLGGQPGISLLIAGYGSLSSEIVSLAERHKNIEYYGEINPKDVLNFYQKCHLVFNIVDTDIMHEKVGFPNRLFDAMAAGRGILVSKGTFADELAKELEYGIAIDPSKASILEFSSQIKDNLPKIIEMGQKGKLAFDAKYNWDAQKEVLLSMYDGLSASQEV